MDKISNYMDSKVSHSFMSLHIYLDDIYKLLSDFYETQDESLLVEIEKKYQELPNKVVVLGDKITYSLKDYIGIEESEIPAEKTENGFQL